MTLKEKIARLKREISRTRGMIERYKRKREDSYSHSFSTSFDSIPSGTGEGYSEKIRDYEFRLQILEKKLAELEAIS